LEHSKNDDRYKEITSLLEINREDLNATGQHIDRVEVRMTETELDLTQKIDHNYERLF